MHLKISSAKWQPFCPRGDELIFHVHQVQPMQCSGLEHREMLPLHRQWSSASSSCLDMSDQKMSSWLPPSHQQPPGWKHLHMSLQLLTHWGRVTHICVDKLSIIGSDNGLSPGRRQAIIWTNSGILLIGPLGTNFSEILIRIQIFSIKEM